MITRTEARARVRDAAGPELLERLEHLDATRARRPTDPCPPRAPDAGARTDYDVVLAGGGLSLLYAPVLALQGLRVAVFDRGRVGAAHREWNASAKELQALVESGCCTAPELDALIVSRYERGTCRWHGGGSYPVTRVLDHAVDAGRLLSGARTRAEALGVKLFDGHALVGLASGRDAVALRFHTLEGAPREVTARVLLDARGASSPSATADLLCPTVGGVMTDLVEGSAPDEVNPREGEILATTEGVDDGRQHLWEAFPGHRGETTVYLFYYARAEDVGDGALLRLYARFFDRLSGYKRGPARLSRATFGFIPGWSRLGPAPAPPGPRVVLVGDAAARHSPLTYCGFGATLRSLVPASRALARALAEGRDPGASGPLVHDTPLHAGTGALAHVLASPPADPARRGELNALLDAAFATLHAMGDEPYGALLRDELSPREFARFLWSTASRRPSVYRQVLGILGAGGAARWGAGIFRGIT